MYKLKRSIRLDCTPLEAWSFISRPENLNFLTPDEFHFQMVSSPPEEIFSGLLLEYRVKIPILGTTRWVGEIKHVDEGRSFVDEQRIGPYAFWYHYHLIEPLDRGVRMTDEVCYQVPYGPVGKIANHLFVRRMLKNIFDYREEKLPLLIGPRQPNEGRERN